MIGRTLDAILSPFQIMARECRSEGVDSPFLYLVNAMRNSLLPVEKCRYWDVGKGDEHKVVLSDDNWVMYFPEDWELKRECAKAFENRRKVRVGENFSQNAELHSGFGTIHKEFEVKRISKDAVAYKGYLISSSKKTLLENKNAGYTPVLYRGVIW